MEDGGKALNHFQKSQEKNTNKYKKLESNRKIEILKPSYQNKIHLFPGYVNNKRDPLKTYCQGLYENKKMKNDIPDKI